VHGIVNTMVACVAAVTQMASITLCGLDGDDMFRLLLLGLAMIPLRRRRR